MATTTAPVIFGYGPEGARAGRVRFVVPTDMKPQTLRAQIRRGNAALHGPSNPNEHRYRLLFACDTGGWSSWGYVDTVD